MSQSTAEPVPFESAEVNGPEANPSEQVPPQRWQIFPSQPQQCQVLTQSTGLSPLLSQVLINRGIHTPEQAWLYLDPETQQLPSPLDEFPDLAASVGILMDAIATQKPIAICGDYDADGMTSTALLIRALRNLGALVNYAIPSRMQEGYGINERIIEDFHAEGVRVILTVDNGIAALKPIQRAKELGLTVIITDHHDIPETLPPADAILNPKLLPVTSLYRGVAGVGVAYILAVCLAQQLDQLQDLTVPLLELFTLGTIADLAPLTGVNRRWVRRGLGLLPKSRIPGIQALIEISGLGSQDNLKPEAIGFRLGPRINAVGRIADPQIVIEMLTTDDIDIALERALQCEETNKLRQRLCEIIETQAIDWCEDQQAQGKLDLKKERVLVVIQPDWHHGVIGIVASRLVERYGVPVFIGTYEDKSKKEIRGSARSIPEFNVFEALQACDDLMNKYGGHRAAGGFSFEAKKLRQVKTRLSKVAHQQLQPEHLKPLVTVDVQANLADATFDLYQQIDQLHPCGIENPDPVFWTAGINVVEQQIIGKDQKHLKLTLSQTHPLTQRVTALKALAWRWGEHHPLPRELDVAYKLRLNEWRGEKNIELEIVGVRLPKVSPSEGIRPWSAAEQSRVEAQRVAQAVAKKVQSAERVAQTVTPADTAQQPPRLTPRSPELPNLHPGQTLFSNSPDAHSAEAIGLTDRGSPAVSDALASAAQPSPITPSPAAAEFFYGKRRYISAIDRHNGSRELKIQNAEGHLLVVKLTERQAVLHLPDQLPQVVDLAEPHYFSLLRAGLNALELKQKTTLLIRKDELLGEKDSQIDTLTQQVQLLEEKISQLSQAKQAQFKTLQTELQQQETAIHTQEAHIVELQTQITRPDVPLPDPKQIKQSVREAVGDSVWFCIQTGTQKDLFAAYKNAQMIGNDGADPHIADFSEAGIRLGFAVEREIVTPFFKDLYEYLLTHGGPEIGGIQMGPSKKYTIGMVPSLLATGWKTLRPEALKQPIPVEEQALYRQAKANNQVGGRDRTLIAEFLAQWEHPMSNCFSQKAKQAAASIDQISRLRNLSAHSDSFLYQWHYDLLKELIVGSSQRRGLFRQIYGG